MFLSSWNWEGAKPCLQHVFCRKVAHAKTKQQQNMALLLWSCAFKAKYNVGTLFCYCEAVPSKQNTMLEHGLAAVKLCIQSKNQVSTNMLLQCNNNLYIKRIQLHKYVLGWFSCTTKKSLHQTTCVSGVFETKRVSEKDSVGRCVFFSILRCCINTHRFRFVWAPKGLNPKGDFDGNPASWETHWNNNQKNSWWLSCFVLALIINNTQIGHPTMDFF